MKTSLKAASAVQHEVSGIDSTLCDCRSSLVVDGEKYDSVASVSYLCNVPHTAGGAEVVTTRAKRLWKKFRELVQIVTS